MQGQCTGEAATPFSIGAATRIGAALLILIGGAIHAYEMPAQYSSVRYLGILFAANVAGALIAAAGIYRDKPWAWVLGILVAGGALAAYAITRTVGLPQDTGDIGNWGEPLGVVALVAEGAFVLLALGSNSTWRRRIVDGTAA